MSEAAPNPKPQITVHPAAAIFPMMSDEELAEMASSIKKNGLREKIHAVISVSESKTDWEVLDGRNRLEALRRYLKMSDADIIASHMTPITLSGAYTPEEYVMMANIERRNLTSAQRRELAGKLAIMLEERQKELPKEERTDSLEEAAKKAGVSRRTTAAAKKEAKEQAKAPEQKKSTTPKAPTYTPLKPGNVLAMTENIYKTLSYEETLEVGGKKTTRMYLDNWTIEEIRKVEQVFRASLDLFGQYLEPRLQAEREALEKKLDAMNRATS